MTIATELLPIEHWVDVKAADIPSETAITDVSRIGREIPEGPLPVAQRLPDNATPTYQVVDTRMTVGWLSQNLVAMALFVSVTLFMGLTPRYIIAYAVGVVATYLWILISFFQLSRKNRRLMLCLSPTSSSTTRCSPIKARPRRNNLGKRHGNASVTVDSILEIGLLIILTSIVGLVSLLMFVVTVFS